MLIQSTISADNIAFLDGLPDQEAELYFFYQADQDGQGQPFHTYYLEQIIVGAVEIYKYMKPSEIKWFEDSYFSEVKEAA